MLAAAGQRAHRQDRLEGGHADRVERALPAPPLLPRERRLPPPLHQLPHRRRLAVGLHLLQRLRDERRGGGACSDRGPCLRIPLCRRLRGRPARCSKEILIRMPSCRNSDGDSGHQVPWLKPALRWTLEFQLPHPHTPHDMRAVLSWPCALIRSCSMQYVCHRYCWRQPQRARPQPCSACRNLHGWNFKAASGCRLLMTRPTHEYRIRAKNRSCECCSVLVLCRPAAPPQQQDYVYPSISSKKPYCILCFQPLIGSKGEIRAAVLETHLQAAPCLVQSASSLQPLSPNRSHGSFYDVRKPSADPGEAACV